MTHLLAFAAGIAVGVVIALNAVYRQEPPAQPWTRDDDEPIAPADPRPDEAWARWLESHDQTVTLS